MADLTAGSELNISQTFLSDADHCHITAYAWQRVAKYIWTFIENEFQIIERSFLHYSSNLCGSIQTATFFIMSEGQIESTLKDGVLRQCKLQCFKYSKQN